MERESFEDAEVANLLNDKFISIKVDKEERPDIDNIYMNVCQMMTGGGGWPLSLFMTHKQKPFYSGTYFPKYSRYGMRGFIEILNFIIHLWENDREKLLSSSEKIMKALEQDGHKTGLDEDKLPQKLYAIHQENFDRIYGGFEGAPKFPSPHNIYFLLRYYQAYGDSGALAMAEKTLTSMYKGGIYDHIGYGFCRYSTDEKWLVPHFEKMLYDNALLAIAYTEAYLLTKNPLYEKCAREIFIFIEREMTTSEGGFYTAIDADSEGIEGKYYLWESSEINKILDDNDGADFCEAYGITPEGNFEGKNIPNLIDKEISDFPLFKKKLLGYREKRTPPLKDDKTLTSLNGMMIAAYAFAGRVFDDTSYINTAKKAVLFINNKLMKEGRLLARYRDGSAGIPAYADDYAYFIWGLIETYQATSDEQYLKTAVELTEQMEKLFWDIEKGGFYLYGNDAEKLITRPKDFYDGAVPSANSVAAHNYLKLSLHDNVYLQKADDIIKCFSQNHPAQITHLVSAVILRKNLSKIVISGNESIDGFPEMKKCVNRTYLPFSLIIFINGNEEYKTVENRATAYICKNNSCLPPIINFEKLKSIL
ncbi:spermatogenesis-associated protein 20 [Holotrichia oblita]|nr:spermatogenesis-associated protein 20 [Holotrichia oblita]